MWHAKGRWEIHEVLIERYKGKRAIGIYSLKSEDIIVTHMPIARQRLGKHIPEAYALNNRTTSIAR
jgi:hypothetical protein